MSSGKLHRYTKQEHELLQSFIPGHTYKEIAEEYNKNFSEPITEARVKCYMANHKINNGLTGRFKKGHIPHNKGQKGVCAKGCEKTWFKKGHLPENTKPIEYERIGKDGYISVKVKMRPSEPGRHDNFKFKHHIVWEEHNGPIPKGYKIIFLDGNKKNCEIENLAIVSTGENMAMNARHLRTDNKELTKAGVLYNRIIETTKKKRDANNI